MNGTEMEVPNRGVLGEAILKQMGVKPGRRGVFSRGTHMKEIVPQKVYSPKEFTNKNGTKVSLQNIPERVLGAERSLADKFRLAEEITDLVGIFKDVDYDQRHQKWVRLNSYLMPKRWGGGKSQLLIDIPENYPNIPPIGFYIPKNRKSPNGHLFNRGYHGAAEEYLQMGWNWYCCLVPNGNWIVSKYTKPGSWRNGDNLIVYTKLISETLANAT